MQNFRQWLVENSLAPHFQLSELKRQFGIDNEVIDGVVCFAGGVGPVAKEIDGKHFDLKDWTELYVGEGVTVEDVTKVEENDDEKFFEEDGVVNFLGTEKPYEPSLESTFKALDIPIISPNKGKK